MVTSCAYHSYPDYTCPLCTWIVKEHQKLERRRFWRRYLILLLIVGLLEFGLNSLFY